MGRPEYGDPSSDKFFSTIQTDARDLFLGAIGELVPDVLTDLRDRVLPLYAAADEACCGHLRLFGGARELCQTFPDNEIVRPLAELHDTANTAFAGSWNPEHR